jgi:hypothetical protein
MRSSRVKLTSPRTSPGQLLIRFRTHNGKMDFGPSFSSACFDEEKRKIGQLALMAGSRTGSTLITLCSRPRPLVALVRHCYSSDSPSQADGLFEAY